MDHKEGRESDSHKGTDETYFVPENSSKEGKESSPLETNGADSVLERNPKEDKENTVCLEDNDADSALKHKKSGSSSSSSSLASITVDRDILSNAILNSNQDGELETFSEDAEEPFMLSTPATQSPQQIVTMGRPSGYDPNRIPASVFASKPSTPMDWSVASNESLFSIHVGNSSFSKDQFYLMMGRSGELPRLDEEFDMTGLPTVTEGADGYTQDDDTDYSSRFTESSAAHPNAATEDFKKYRMHPTDDVSSSGSPAAPRISISRSDDTRASDVSTRSFAFPVLIGDGRKSNSGLGERTKHKTHAKPQPEPSGQRAQPEIPKAIQKPARWRWLSCFPCCCQNCY